jgi:hypothetical protein
MCEEGKERTRGEEEKSGELREPGKREGNQLASGWLVWLVTIPKPRTGSKLGPLRRGLPVRWDLHRTQAAG